MTDALDAAREMIEHRRSGALVTDLATATRVLVDASGSHLAGEATEAITAASSRVAALIATGRSGTIDLNEGEVFVEVILPAPRLLVFGAGPIAEALSAMAALAGFVVEVGDPRPAFAVASRFPDADSVVVGWPADLVGVLGPDDTSYVVSLLHEERFESELLPSLLRSPARYLGALGSRRTHAARVERLRSEGFTEKDVGRIRGPIGLDIGAVSPAEIAVAILAQLVAVRRGAGS